MNNKQVSLNVKLKDFFKLWLKVTRPFHKLTQTEENLLSLLLYYHYIYRKEITNNKILWKIVFDYDTKLKIKEELNMNDNRLQTSLTILRKKKIIVNNTISPVFIPNLSLDSKEFKVVYNFKILENGS